MGRSSLPVILFYMLVSSLISQSTVFSFHFRKKELFEGDQCLLSNDEEGVCKKLMDCPHQLENYHNRTLEAITKERCGFEGIMEIVCCPVVSTRISDNNNLTMLNIKSTEGTAVPYLAWLGFQNENPSAEESPFLYLCGGSLISPRHVLATASCILSANHPLHHVLLGTNHTNFVEPGDYVQNIPIESVVIRPGYVLGLFTNDLAILIMDSDASITSFVKPIRIHGISTISMEDSKLKVVGLANNGSDSKPKQLTKYDTKIVDDQECAEIYNNVSQIIPGIDVTLFCGMSPNRLSTPSSCVGENGFPLTLTNRDETEPELLVGVTAARIDCSTNFPVIYTLVFPYIPWIDKLLWMHQGSQPYSPRFDPLICQMELIDPRA